MRVMTDCYSYQEINHIMSRTETNRHRTIRLAGTARSCSSLAAAAVWRVRSTSSTRAGRHAGWRIRFCRRTTRRS